MNKYVIPFRSSFELAECIIVTNSTSLIVMKMCRQIRISLYHPLTYSLHFSLLNKMERPFWYTFVVFNDGGSFLNPYVLGLSLGEAGLSVKGAWARKKSCFPDVHKLIPLWNHYHVFLPNVWFILHLSPELPPSLPNLFLWDAVVK